MLHISVIGNYSNSKGAWELLKTYARYSTEKFQNEPQETVVWTLHFKSKFPFSSNQMKVYIPFSINVLFFPW